jgi:AraC family transcriptional regulator, regulatory protein of adaptative response / methylated-DNA-[protein]-cysteine methyltransferase
MSPTMTSAQQAAALRTEQDPRWAAVLARDARFDGRFVVAVKTTGVYCRPICSGRPKPQNVAFYANNGEAERAGFRACKRCRPQQLACA